MSHWQLWLQPSSIWGPDHTTLACHQLYNNTQPQLCFWSSRSSPTAFNGAQVGKGNFSLPQPLSTACHAATTSASIPRRTSVSFQQMSMPLCHTVCPNLCSLIAGCLLGPLCSLHPDLCAKLLHLVSTRFAVNDTGIANQLGNRLPWANYSTRLISLN